MKNLRSTAVITTAACLLGVALALSTFHGTPRAEAQVPYQNGYNTVVDEGAFSTPLHRRTKLNCVGSSITCADDATHGATTITVAGASTGNYVFNGDGLDLMTLSDSMVIGGNSTGTVQFGNATIGGFVASNGGGALVESGGANNMRFHFSETISDSPITVEKTCDATNTFCWTSTGGLSGLSANGGGSAQLYLAGTTQAWITTADFSSPGANTTLGANGGFGTIFTNAGADGGGVSQGSTTALGTCDSTAANRSRCRILRGAGGVSDKYECCMTSSADAYAWAVVKDPG